MVERIKEGSVIITEGRVYALFHDTDPKDNRVCSRCELREKCETGVEINAFSKLCLTNGVSGDAFFLECNPMASKSTRDIAFQQNILEAIASAEEATAEL